MAHYIKVSTRLFKQGNLLDFQLSTILEVLSSMNNIKVSIGELPGERSFSREEWYLACEGLMGVLELWRRLNIFSCSTCLTWASSKFIDKKAERDFRHTNHESFERTGWRKSI